jgi:hypothetical protein
VQIDSGATAANIVQGSIGLLASAAKGVNIITSFDKGVLGLRPVVFLNALTSAQVWPALMCSSRNSAAPACSLSRERMALRAMSWWPRAVMQGWSLHRRRARSVTFALLKTVIGQAYASPLSAQLCQCDCAMLPVEQG